MKMLFLGVCVGVLFGLLATLPGSPTQQEKDLTEKTVFILGYGKPLDREDFQSTYRDSRGMVIRLANKETYEKVKIRLFTMQWADLKEEKK